MRDHQGAIGGTTAFIQHVTETRLQKLDSPQFEELFKCAPFPMALISLDGVYERGNPPMCALLGYTEYQLAGLMTAILR